MFKNVNTAWTGCPIGLAFPGAQVPFLSFQYCMSFCTPLPIPLSIGLAFPGTQVSSQYCMSPPHPPVDWISLSRAHAGTISVLSILHVVLHPPPHPPVDWISLSWYPGTISVLSILHVVLHPPPHPPVDWIGLSWCPHSKNDSMYFIPKVCSV